MTDMTIVKEAGVDETLSPRQVAEAWFSSLEQNRLQDAQALLDENVVWENIPSTPGVSDLAPWLGSYRGLPKVLKSIEAWAAHALAVVQAAAASG